MYLMYITFIVYKWCVDREITGYVNIQIIPLLMNIIEHIGIVYRYYMFLKRFK